MQIAILISRSDRSFVTRHMVDVAKDLSLRGHEVRLVTVLRDETNGYADELGLDHISINVRSMSNGVSELSNLIKSGAPDLLLSAGLEANCVAALSVRLSGVQCPMIFFEQDVPGYEHRGTMASRRFWTWMRKKAYPSADKIIVPAYEVQRRLLNVAPVDPLKICQINNPGRGYFSPPIKAPHQWLSETRSDPTFVSAGVLDKNSDIETLIEGVRRAQKLMPCKVVVLGEGPQKKKLFELSKSKGVRNRIAFASDIENMHDYVYFSDGFIFNALSAACPDVVIRSMELTSRIICTASPGGSRELIGDGRFGKMLRMQDPDALVYALIEAMKTPKMRPAEREIERFDREQFFESVSDIVNQVGSLEGTAFNADRTLLAE